MAVVLETTVGDITIDLYLQERPRTCLNFLKLCKVKYYHFCTFHKIERNFVAQTGDPSGTGRGGECIFGMLYGEQAKFFEAEMTPRLKHRKLGTVSMVNNGDNVHGSQFFITLGEDLDYLDGVHTVFGEVTEGLDVLVKLNDAICDEEHRPYQDILITHTVVLDDPFDDPKGLIIPVQSPEPTEEHLKSSRIGATEDIDDTKGKSMEEIEEEIKTKEAKARATILEMIGDIPDAEVRPPDNVLFVCKLNPVTTAEDLEIIFSRFGVIKSCEVICDKKTGESLQYAFIEFEKPEDCENAYFKMDNVLIDDRRIHVDFSQSVSKLKWKGKNPEKDSSKSEKPSYVIKEKAQSKKDDRYEMVFDNEDNIPSEARLTELVAVPSEEKTAKASHRRMKKKHKKKKMLEEDNDSNRQSQKKGKSEKLQKTVPESSDSEAAKKDKTKKTKNRSSSSSSSSDSDKNGIKDQKKKAKLPAAYRYSNELEKRHSRRHSGSSPESPGGGSGDRRRNRTSRGKDDAYDRFRSRPSRSRSRSHSKSRSQGYRKGRDSRTPTDGARSYRATPFASNAYRRASESRYDDRNRKTESRPRSGRDGRTDRSPSRSYRSPVRSSKSIKDRRTDRRSRSRS